VSNCRADENTIHDALKSFPSGHSNAAFVSMTFVVLFLIKTREFSKLKSLPLLRRFVLVSPMIYAIFVAASRCVDYRHHYADVICGALIGAISAFIAFSASESRIMPWLSRERHGVDDTHRRTSDCGQDVETVAEMAEASEPV
jgi:diacylglycerol diphosphate phosphatase / phosphatidate phosphatase